MPFGNPPSAFAIFVCVWAILGVATAVFFTFNRNAQLKRVVFPPFVIGIGVVFATFVWLMHGRHHPDSLILLVPGVTMVTLLNLWITRFCDACGRTVVNRGGFSRPKYCHKCGAPLP
jgi:hypothetical protein